MAFVETQMLSLPPASVCLPRVASFAGDLESGQRLIPEETAIAFTFKGE